jgi:hypothetical protein
MPLECSSKSYQARSQNGGQGLIRWQEKATKLQHFFSSLFKSFEKIHEQINQFSNSCVKARCSAVAQPSSTPMPFIVGKAKVASNLAVSFLKRDF